MIDQIGLGRTFDEAAVAGRRLGVGMNLEIEVPDLGAIAARIAPVPVLIPVEEKWYRVDAGAFGQRQMVLRDPDGDLLRPFQPLQ